MLQTSVCDVLCLSLVSRCCRQVCVMFCACPWYPGIAGKEQVCVMFCRKLSQQARMTQQARAATQSMSKNITVVSLKRRSTDNSGSGEPPKVARTTEPNIASVGFRMGLGLPSLFFFFIVVFFFLIFCFQEPLLSPASF